MNSSSKSFLGNIGQWPQQRWPWVLLASAATSFIIIALWMQHVNDQQPCEQCIYQRTAMLGIALFAWFGVLAPQRVGIRLIAFAGWLWTSWAGLAAANYHLWFQREANPLFTSCSAIPNFPSWAPLHEWLPSVFAITGMCGDDGWRLMGLNMPEWMQIIFATFFGLGVFILAIRLITTRRI
ncbi:MAG: disulfide bond formation protein B [Gammaproteobacteria bacterium]|nr:disulfide bond formation protein B [Gammaproteobacteria bacterium]